MAKNQSRRSISVRGETYRALRSWCDERGLAMSECVEALIAAQMGGHPSPSLNKALAARPMPVLTQPAVERAPAPPRRPDLLVRGGMRRSTRQALADLLANSALPTDDARTLLKDALAALPAEPAPTPAPVPVPQPTRMFPLAKKAMLAPLPTRVDTPFGPMDADRVGQKRQPEKAPAKTSGAPESVEGGGPTPAANLPDRKGGTAMF